MFVYNNQQQLTRLCSFQEYSVLLQSPPRNNGNQGQHAIKRIMKCVAFFMFILYIFSQEIYGDNGRIYQINNYKKMLTPNYGCVDATDKFTCSDTVSVLYLS